MRAWFSFVLLSSLKNQAWFLLIFSSILSEDFFLHFLNGGI